MPRSREQYEKIRQQKKLLILDSALELFAESGFHATSMSDIAKKAKVSKGLAYNYFESKQEILEEIFNTGFDSIYSHFDLNHDGILTRDEFEHFIHKSFGVIRENRKFWKLYSAIVMQGDLSDSLMRTNTVRSEHVVSVFSQFIVSMGSQDPEGDLMVISSLVKGALSLVISAPDVFPVKELEDRVTKACLKLITSQPVMI